MCLKSLGIVGVRLVMEGPGRKDNLHAPHNIN